MLLLLPNSFNFADLLNPDLPEFRPFIEP